MNIYTKNINFRTVLDYGAKVYSTIDDALNGESFHEAGQKMLDKTGTCLLPPYGWMKLDDSIFLWKSGDSIQSLGQGNKGLRIVATKPISMFLPINEFQEIRGFTAYYVGDKITKECGVVRAGGDDRNVGGSYYNRDTGNTTEHFWARRTRINRLILDFDIVGDARYYWSRRQSSPYNKNDRFIENGNVHGFWVNYDDNLESDHSHCHDVKIKGTYAFVNTPIKINRKSKTQSLNTFDIDLSVWGARQFCNIKGINFSKIQIMGQEILGCTSDTENKELPLFEVSGSSIKSNIFIYDLYDGRENRHKKKGQYNVSRLDLQGYYSLLNDWYTNPQGTKILNADLNESTLINHSWIINK